MNTSESVKDRIFTYINHQGLSIKGFEKKCGLSNGYLRQLRHEPSRRKMEMIINTYPDLNPIWLLTGEGEMIQDSGAEQPPTPVRAPSGQPYYDVDFAAGFVEMINDQTTLPSGYVNLPAYNREGIFWCNVTGHSMEPTINHGDIIALRELHDWHTFLPKGEIYAIITTNGLRTIKIIRKGSDEHHLRLVPINTSEYDEEEISIESIMKVFIVHGNIKQF